VLSDEDRRALLDLARGAIEAAVRGGRAPTPRNPSGALREKGAAFVTLRRRGELRGCIGHLEGVAPLWESVLDMAQAAALRDSRFPPLGPGELEELQIEISVLSPMSPIEPDQIQVGRHGLYVKRDTTAGLLLPQVAEEWQWDPTEFLRRTYEKAGLSQGDPLAKVYAFTAERFSS
jgi:AmmeMemoRadiSam system protein A